MIRLVLFDIDGTLVHTGGAGIEAFRQTFADEFDAHDGIEKLKFAGRTDVSLVREFFSIHQIPATPENFRRFFEQYVFRLDHVLVHNKTSICPGVREFIHELQSVPQPPLLGLLTGNIQLGAEIKLRHFDLWETFTTGGFADDHEDRDQIAVAAHKRANRVMKENLRGEEILVIGDTPFDIRCGRAISAKVLAVATGGAKLQELVNHKPDWAVADLTRVSARDVCR